jgi:hypothetical protein
MQNNNDMAIKTLQVLSNERASDCNPGALLVNGGITCKDSMFIHRSLICSRIKILDTIDTNNDIIKLNCSIIPNFDNYCLGSEEKIWSNIFIKNIDCKSQIKSNNITSNNICIRNTFMAGTNKYKNKNGIYSSLFEINSNDLCNKTSIVIKSENTYFVDPIKNDCYLDISPDSINTNKIFNVGDLEKPTLKIEPDNNRVLLFGDLVLFGNGLIRNFKKININSSEKTLDLTEQITLLKIDPKIQNLNLILPNNINGENILPGLSRKIVIYQSNNSKVQIKSLEHKINNGVEIMYDGCKWLIIGCH